MRQRLTDLIIERVQPPAAGRQELWDVLIPGFGLRVTAKGAKSWVLMYRLGGRKAQKRRLTLGTYPKVTLAMAREMARRSLMEIAKGFDPVTETKKREDDDTFASVAEQFIERYAKPRNRGWKKQESDIEKDLLPYWRSRKVASITRKDILHVLDRVSDRASPIRANRILALIRKIFNWCLERGILEISPAANIKPPGKEVSRDRVLSDEEIRCVWIACDEIGYPFGAIVQLLLITGQRRDEVGRMRWRDIDDAKGLWTVPREISKNNVANEVPLSPLALKLLRNLPLYLDSEFIFPAANRSGKPFSGYEKCKRRLDVMANAKLEAQGDRPMQPWRLHDLRRTTASSMARLGAAPHVIERVLNHISGSLSGVAGIYNRYGYAAEKREALEKWATYVDTILGARPASESAVTSATTGPGTRA